MPLLQIQSMIHALSPFTENMALLARVSRTFGLFSGYSQESFRILARGTSVCLMDFFLSFIIIVLVLCYLNEIFLIVQLNEC
ncbi:hypothetical protein BDP27DRAFT_1312926 [Rhodocollybia butyracea]|uniref:Uncharacterized protein n=1 Tax=Rhodocollybia butyracea TaxID=206335 RepID=A0A9P5QAT2_9AGAR|nr:hypothetical protein BDP27DRAFT_1312926 [Rhodocollybia butyracea]